MAHPTLKMPSCLLCNPTREAVLWRDERCRVIMVGDADYPGFCRVVWHQHVQEMTDLTESERAHFMRVVFSVERALRDAMRPDKINLASFGNQVPHLHWHAIPRFTDDAHFPDPVWAMRKREGKAHPPDRLTLVQRLEQALGSSVV